MEQAIIEILTQMPVVAVLVAAWWYYRKDMLDRIENLEETIEKLYERNEWLRKPPPWDDD